MKDEHHKSTCQFMGFKKQYFGSQQQLTSYFKKGLLIHYNMQMRLTLIQSP